ICYICGAALHEQPPRKAGKKWLYGLIVTIIIFGIGGFCYFYFITAKPLEKLAYKAYPPESIKQKDNVDPSAPAVSSEQPADTQKKPDPLKPSLPQKMKIAIGIVIIRDVTDKSMVQHAAPVLAGGWVALPRRLCLGGYHWVLTLGADKELDILHGLIGQDDPIGLWRVTEDQTIQGPELAAWIMDKPVEWMSLQSETQSKPVKITVQSNQQHFIKATLTGNINEPGILLQQGKVVGWTFGSLLEDAYLWNGPAGADLGPEIRVDDFYQATFANSREEEFLMARAMGDDYTHLERLAAFANGYRFDSKLAVTERPDYLQNQAVVSEMRVLIKQAVEEGFAEQVANIFDAQILVQASDVALVGDVINATVEGYDFEEATVLAEDVAQRIQLSDSKDKLTLIQMRSKLYQNWISSLIDNGNIQAGWNAYELGRQNLPEDLEIHLLGVKLALAQNDWAAAEKLIAMREYPLTLQDRVQNLQAQISDLKGQEGKIVIQFRPGTRNIPVTAVLNQTVEQKFIVDTGASTVTIPSSTADRLGLSVDSGNPMRKVVTASGVIDAPEVILPSITVEGWEVTDITALVVDIPSQSDLGLLGLNFLGRFRMDLNTDEGILLLEPR
ncbi:MAG: retropepsin-like aspartic protease, partial [Desulfobacterales bacterium]